MTDTIQHECALTLRLAGSAWRLSLQAFVHDKPGELASICSFMAKRNANIERFEFNRSNNAHKVDMEVSLPSPEAAGPLARDALNAGVLFDPNRMDDDPDHAGVIEPEGLLRLKIHIQDQVGAMASLAELFRKHDANVLQMSYNGDETPGLILVSTSTASPEKAKALLDEMNGSGLSYHVEWTGSKAGGMGQLVENILGLNEVENFIVRLTAMLPADKRASVEELIRSTSDLRQCLVDFRREACETGEALAASEVFSIILQITAASAARTGQGFALTCTGPLDITEQLTLTRLACPTGANSYLVSDGEGHLLIDSSYGLYYADAMAWLRARGVDPARIELMLLTHADADHAGWAYHLQQEFGTPIMRHPDTQAVFEAENRAEGAETRLHAMNGAYTRLINRFSDLRIPEKMEDFPPHPEGGDVGGFPVAGLVKFRDLELTVLHSLGGHIPGNVFFLDKNRGIFFSGDYLIDVPSLSDRSKETLSLPRYLLTSTNADSRLFGREMEMLRGMMRQVAASCQPGAIPRIFPGHGDFYGLAEALW